MGRYYDDILIHGDMNSGDHKYIRKYLGRNGKYIYVYKIANAARKAPQPKKEYEYTPGVFAYNDDAPENKNTWMKILDILTKYDYPTKEEEEKLEEVGNKLGINEGINNPKFRLEIIENKDGTYSARSGYDTDSGKKWIASDVKIDEKVRDILELTGLVTHVYKH